MNENPERIKTLLEIADKIDEIQKRPIYDTLELNVCEVWLGQFLILNESLHEMELVYWAWIKWKLRWMRDELEDVDTNDDESYYKSVNEFIEGQLMGG
jgi:hypothetical protein